MERAVGIRDLPGPIRVGFRGHFIRRIIKSVFTSTSPWVNPPIETLQQEFDATYPNHHVKLHLDDAAVVPVFFSHRLLLGDRAHARTQTIRDLGVLRSQIGQGAVRAISNHLPGQYSKRQFDSKTARAAYIQALISDKQYPFIWETFRPGNLPVGGAKLYYDDVRPMPSVLFQSLISFQKRRGRFQLVPILRAFSVYWTAYGIHTPISPLDPGPGNRPIGALAMAAVAVGPTFLCGPHTLILKHNRLNEDIKCTELATLPPFQTISPQQIGTDRRAPFTISLRRTSPMVTGVKSSRHSID